MTTYFDQAYTECEDLRRSDREDRYEALNALEARVVRDCSICAEFPGFPPHMREPAHRAIATHGVNSLPSWADNPEEDSFAAIRNLISALHSVWHEVAHAGVYPFSDSPLAPLDNLAVEGWDFREHLNPEGST